MAKNDLTKWLDDNIGRFDPDTQATLKALRKMGGGPELKVPSFDNRNGRVLARLYNTTLNRVLQTIEKFDPDKQTFEQLERSIGGMLDEVRDLSFEYVGVEIPDQYATGMNNAETLLDAIGIEIGAVNTGAHETVVQSMMRSTNTNFAKNVNAVRNGVDGAIGEATKQKLLDVFGEGITRAESNKKAVQILRENGVQSIVDRGGKTWSLESYVNMLRRTTARAAFNQGMVNRSLELGVTVFRVSFTGTAHKECAIWERELLSVAGEFGLPTIDEATSTGLFHPNCFHTVFPDPEAQDALEKGERPA